MISDYIQDIKVYESLIDECILDIKKEFNNIISNVFRNNKEFSEEENDFYKWINSYICNNKLIELINEIKSYKNTDLKYVKVKSYFTDISYKSIVDEYMFNPNLFKKISKQL